MLSKAKIKFIKSLQIKKYRKQEQCFIVEGAKSVRELLASDFEVVTLLGTNTFLSSIEQEGNIDIVEVNEGELDGLGQFQTNHIALAVARIKENTPVSVASDEFVLVLDDIRDPGNLGTIVRTADWFGIDKIVASSETADFYNPKVISSTMGSFTRVQVYYTQLEDYLKNVTLPVFGTYLEGMDIVDVAFGDGGFILIGNESNGISQNLEKFVTRKITISKIGKGESLNAGIAAGILCYAATR